MRARRAGGMLGAVALLLLAAPRHVAAKAPDVVLEATPLLGAAAPDRGGWRSLLVHVENKGASAVEGTIELQSRQPWARGEPPLRTSLPFALAPGSKASLEAPIRGFAGGAPAISVRALDRAGEPIAQASLPQTRPFDALLLDLATPSRIAPALRGMQFGSRRAPPYGGRGSTPAIGVTSPPVDTTTGDVVLPELAPSYAAATLVLASGRELRRLREGERAALLRFVLAGGALALALDRPEDLTDPTVVALVGGTPERTPVTAPLRASTTFLVPRDDSAGGSTPTAPLEPLRLAPSDGVLAKLTGFSGANLRASPWGAGASYGLGEVHLLAFDPRDTETASDPWVRHKLADLVRHAYDREPQAALRFSAGSDTTELDAIRRELDPNQATRWTIVVSAVILLVYAVLAGPVTFYNAARKGRPLRALWQLPLWSALTLSLIVLLGLVGKGVSGKARRLTLVDAGAGMPIATALRFRGFFAASSRELVVRATAREHVLDVAGLADDVQRTLIVDRDGPRLSGIRTKPWQTVMLREEGSIELAGGISVVEDGGDYSIKNRSSSDLIGVVARPPGGSSRYFARIKEGESVRLSKGKAVGGSTLPSGTPNAAALDVGAFTAMIEVDHPGLGKAWTAIQPALTDGTEWWPDDVPVLIGALDGGEGHATDSGFGVDYDRVLVRVVGLGGSL